MHFENCKKISNHFFSKIMIFCDFQNASPRKWSGHLRWNSTELNYSRVLQLDIVSASVLFCMPLYMTTEHCQNIIDFLEKWGNFSKKVEEFRKFWKTTQTLQRCYWDVLFTCYIHSKKRENQSKIMSPISERCTKSWHDNIHANLTYFTWSRPRCGRVIRQKLLLRADVPK